MRRADDSGVATAIGAIVVLGVLGTALLYTNAYHVPRQGSALEQSGHDATEAALRELGARLSAGASAPFAHDVPLRAPAAAPPLLSGVVLRPASAEGRLVLDARAPNLTVSVETDAPAGGVPANDPIREAVAGGRMRLYLVGNETQGAPAGSLVASVGGAYSARATYLLEAGALLSTRDARSLALAPPALEVARAGSLTSASWRIPLLAGSAGGVEGAAAGHALLAPGPEAQAVAGRVYSLSIRVDTTSLAAWRGALEDAVGESGTVLATPISAPDNGTVEATILPPPGTPATVKGVEARISAVRYEVSIAARG